MKVLSTGILEITASSSSAKEDFDFIKGKWHVINTKRNSILSGEDGWSKFESESEVTGILTGIGNIEKYTAIREGKPFEGAAFRLFNPQTKLWSIYWADNNTGTLDPPVVGSFQNKTGDFYTRDTYKGQPIIMRFNWDASDAAHPVWSQAFSADEGKTWEWNWYMHFSRNKPEIDANHEINVLEIRNYQIKQGKRDLFNAYFKENFIQSQNNLGGFPMGEYYTQNEPDRFVWFRGFEDMESRFRFLNEFYYGEVWNKHKAVANGMLANNDDVHLLKPLFGLEQETFKEFNKNWFMQKKGIAVLDYYVANQKRDKLISLIRNQYLDIQKQAGINQMSYWISVDQANDFTQLPVFQDKNLVVSISFYNNENDYRKKSIALEKMIDPALKAEMEDTITIHQTKIIYPAS